MDVVSFKVLQGLLTASQTLPTSTRGFAAELKPGDLQG